MDLSGLPVLDPYKRGGKRGLKRVKALAHRGCSLNVNFLSFLGLLAGGGEASDRSHQPDLRETQLCRPRRLQQLGSPVLTRSGLHSPLQFCKALASSPSEPPKKPARRAGQCLPPNAWSLGEDQGLRPRDLGKVPCVPISSFLQQISAHGLLCARR